MATDITCILENTKRRDISQDLSSELHAALSVSADDPIRRKYWPDDPVICYSAGQAPSIYVSPHFVSVNYRHHWHQYLDDDYESARELIRRCNGCLAHFFGSDSVMFVPSDIDPYGDLICVAMHERKLSFQDLVAELNQHRPPSTRFEETMREVLWRDGQTTVIDIIGWLHERIEHGPPADLKLK